MIGVTRENKRVKARYTNSRHINAELQLLAQMIVGTNVAPRHQK